MKVELVWVTPDAEKNIEYSGRTARMSMNKIAEGTDKRFIEMIVAERSESVLEHASAEFRFIDCSRVFTHQLVRHRIASFTQMSGEFTRTDDVIEPPDIAKNPEAHIIFDEAVKNCMNAQQRLIEMGIAMPDSRYVVPNGVKTEICMTANFREWREVIAQRGGAGIHWEIRQMACKVLKILKGLAPHVFEDLKLVEKGEYDSYVIRVNRKGLKMKLVR
jgi:thymidylate synthase (FAD)